MSYHVLYAPHPPQFSVELSLAELTARDARFANLRFLRPRQTLGLTVQDSADLQGAHLRVRLGRRAWSGTPGAWDEDGTAGAAASRRPFHGWSEAALVYALGLDLVPVRQHNLALAELEGPLSRRPAGVAYAFARSAGGAPTLVRRLNLAGDLDRLEFEFLAAAGFAGLDLVRVHGLESGGHEVWRAEARLRPSAMENAGGRLRG